MFTVIFLLECVLKVTAYGFYHYRPLGPLFCNGKEFSKAELNTYLSDHWCKLDFIIVLSSIITLTDVPIPNLGFLRSFRVLRPLKVPPARPPSDCLTTFQRSRFRAHCARFRWSAVKSTRPSATASAWGSAPP